MSSGLLFVVRPNKYMAENRMSRTKTRALGFGADETGNNNVILASFGQTSTNSGQGSFNIWSMWTNLVQFDYIRPIWPKFGQTQAKFGQHLARPSRIWADHVQCRPKHWHVTRFGHDLGSSPSPDVCVFGPTSDFRQLWARSLQTVGVAAIPPSSAQCG